MSTAPPPARGPVAHISYGIGAAAFGIKDQGFSYLLLIFYNQVLGLPAATVGLAILIALFADAVFDLAIGQASDATRSRWGRRHPWIYAGAIPAGLAYWALWNPPAGLDPAGLFFWLLGFAMLVRLLISTTEIPSASLVGELTDDYDERTRFLGWRYLMGWLGGIVAGVLAFAVFLQPTVAQPVGILNRAGYQGYAIFAAVAMATATLTSALLTHRYIRGLKPLPPRAGLGEELAAARAALANPAFLTILSAGLFSAMAVGLATALNVYINSYFWGLSTDAQSLLVLSSLVGAVSALLVAARLGARFGKKHAAMTAFLAAIVVGPSLLLLRLAGVLPGNSDPALLPLLLGHAAVLVTFFVTASILIASMLTDTLEANEAATGRRTEGLYFGASFFIQKCVTGIGVFASGTIIDAIGLTVGARPGSVAPAVLDRLVMVYVPLSTILFLLALTCLSRYGIDRAGFEATRAELARRRG
ncbi:hypothetical protein IP88_11290 [alpha proteobacterium AAP81b]|nr:hypothetical protein IP88_11290 [alpha proteobacterium AAP81b]